MLFLIFIAILLLLINSNRSASVTNRSETPAASSTGATVTTSPVGPGESTATLDASRCDTADEVAVEAWQFTEGEGFYGIGEEYDYWFLCLYGDGVAGRIKQIWADAIDNTYAITGTTYRFESKHRWDQLSLDKQKICIRALDSGGSGYG